MEIGYTKSFDNSSKCLKKRAQCKDRLNDILDFIQNSSDFNELKNNPLNTLYDFEPLKYDLVGFYSFSLQPGKKGTIRLIIKPDEKNNKRIFICYVSLNHYKDFDKSKVIYYDE